MAKYRVTERSFVNNVLVEADTVVEFDGVPSSNLEPIDAAAIAASQPAATNVADLLRQAAAAAGADLSNPAEVAATQATQAAQATADAEAATEAAAKLSAAAEAQTAAAQAAATAALV